MRKSVLILILATSLFSGCSPPEDAKTNLLIVTLDTTRADRFGFTGHDAAHTPNFDAFATDRAVSFDNAITAVPVTFPAHTTILTGTYPVFHGVHDNDGYYLDDGVTTLAEILKLEGFATGAVVAAFPLDSEVNLDQGFDIYDDDYQADWSDSEIEARGPFSFGFLERKADRVNMAVRRWLEDNHDEQFFLWVHYFDPHQPYDPPAPYDSQFSSDPYDGEMAFLDEYFGELLEMLDSRKLLDNTIVVVVGDHGEALGEHGEPTHAHFIYDSTMRVPLLFAVPVGGLPAGVRVPSQVQTVDIAPTLLELLGLPPGPEMQGVSLVPLLEDPEREWSHPALLEDYYNFFHYGWARLRGLRTNEFKFIESPRPELYSLVDDPGEFVNLAVGEPDRVAEFRDRLQSLAEGYETADLGRSAAAQVDDETRQKLEALGYISGSSTESDRSASFPSRAELASQIDPKDKTLILSYSNFIHEMIRYQRFDEVLPIIHNALVIDPENYKLHLQLARSMAAMGRFEEALEVLRSSRSLRPDDAEGYVLEGRVHVVRGEFDKAIAPLSRAVELVPHQVSVLQQLAGAYLAVGDDEQAISHFEAVLELDDSNWATLADLAAAYARTQRWEEARDALQRALNLNPYSSTLRYRIAVFYRDVGDPDFARTMFEEALRISPNHLGANYELGELLTQSGEVTAGRRYLDRVIELAPQSTRAEKARQLIERSSSN